MNFLIGLKEYCKNWWLIKEDTQIRENWAIHNEYLMKTFFPKYHVTGKPQGLLEDFKQSLERIDEKDCLVEKSALLKDLRRAVEILAEIE